MFCGRKSKVKGILKSLTWTTIYKGTTVKEREMNEQAVKEDFQKILLNPEKEESIRNAPPQNILSFLVEDGVACQQQQ